MSHLPTSEELKSPLTVEHYKSSTPPPLPAIVIAVLSVVLNLLMPSNQKFRMAPKILKSDGL